MGKITLLLFSILLLSGCTTKTIVQTEYIDKPCPKFPIEEFKPVEEYNINNVKIEKLRVVIDTETNQITGYKLSSDGNETVIIPKTDFVDFINQYKKIKKNYSILRTNIEEFQKGN